MANNESIEVLDEPRLSNDVDVAGNLAINTSHSQKLDDVILDQIRYLLINAGVTSAMLDLPGASLPAILEKEMSTRTIKRNSSCFTDINEIDLEVARRESSSGFTEFKDTELDMEMRGSVFSSIVKPIDTLNMMAKRSRRLKFLRKSDKEYHIVEDIYSLFWLTKNGSHAFWYSIICFYIKMSLFVIVFYWIYRPGGFRDQQLELFPAPQIVNVTQFLLLPVAIVISEELMISMDVAKWTYQRLESRPHATFHKYWISNLARLFDGIFWLLIIMSLMVYATDILNMFLNFAALQFLQSVDNAAYDMARRGHLTDTLEKRAKQVSETTLLLKRNTWRDYLGTILLLFIYATCTLFWALVNYGPNWCGQGLCWDYHNVQN